MQKLFTDERYFQGIPNILHFFEYHVSFNDTESVIESMGSILGSQASKQRGSINHEMLGKETFIRWNSPSICNATGLLQQAFEKHLEKGHWKPITTKSKFVVSKVIDSILEQQSKFPFF